MVLRILTTQNMKLKTPQEKRAKKKAIAEKLSIRQVWKTTPKEKKGATWEFELFKKIALERSYPTGSQYESMRYVLAEHIYPDWEPWKKKILLQDLTPTNFSHTIPKSRWEKYRLDPSNIEIVSRAWHHYEHTRQILKVDYPN